MKERIFYEEFDAFYYYGGSTQNWNMQGFHFHKNYEVILFMSEGATISIENRVYTVEKGDLFLINSKEYHKTSGVEGKEYHRYVMMFDPDALTEIGTAMGYSFMGYFEERAHQFIHKINLTGSHLDEVIRLFHKIEASQERVQLLLGIMELLVTINRLYDFFSPQRVEGEKEESERPVNPQVKAHDRERIELIKKYIRDHVEDKLDLEDLSARFFINKYYLSHYFKKETGFTISQYITNHKIMAAKVMLKQGFSVTETAVALSYYSDSHFINTFKKMTGTTPKKYATGKPLK